MSRGNYKEIFAAKTPASRRKQGRIVYQAVGFFCGRSLRQYCVQSLYVLEAQVRAAFAPSQKRYGWMRMASSHTSQAAMAMPSRLQL